MLNHPRRLVQLGLLSLASLASFGLAGACGGDGQTQLTPPVLAFSGPPALTVASTSGQLSLGVRWSPDPPTVGLAAAEMTLTDSTSAPATGLTLTVVPWMPSHGHGSSTTPTVSEMSPGVYVATPIDFFMMGQWELRTTIAGAIDDTVTPSFQLQ